jgi:formiminotetrahydrofolate cyclodeaminase
MAIGRETLSDLLERSVGRTLEDVSRRQLPAAGGSSAGLAGALAAALTSMVGRSARLTWAGSGGAIAQAEVLRSRLCALTASDTEAFVRARNLLERAERQGTAQPPDTSRGPADSERRDYDLAGALDAAAAVPLAIAETSADVAALAAWAAKEAGNDARADAIVAAILAEAAAAAAAQLVLVNLAVGPDCEYATRADSAARVAAESRTQALACAD